MAYIGNPPLDVRSFGTVKFEFTATAGQTAFTGSDDNGKTLGFTEGQIEVYVNGVLMDSDDFTTSGGNTVTLGSAAAADDIITVNTLKSNAPITDYVQTTGGTFSGDVSVEGTLTSDGLTVDGAASVDGGSGIPLTLDVDAGANTNLQFNENGALRWYLRSVTSSNDFNFYSNGASRLNIASGGDISFYDTSGNAKFFWDASAEALGIGTTSPSGSGLHIRKNTSATTNELLRLSNSAGSTTDGVKLVMEVANTSGNGGEIGTVRDGGSFNPYMYFSTSAGVGSSPVERMRIDSAGRVGVGITPSAWSSGTKVVQVDGASYASINGTNPFVTDNAYWDGSNWRYITNGPASNYYAADSGHSFRRAVSGTAGNPVSWSNSWSVNGSGSMSVPNQPAFIATRSSNFVIGTTESIIALDSEDLDTQGNWNLSSYRFTAPISGRYLFTLQATLNSINSGTYNAIYIKKNGTGTGYRFRTLTGSGWTGINGACMISLSTNDYIELWGYTASGSMTIQGNEVHFCGTLLG